MLAPALFFLFHPLLSIATCPAGYGHEYVAGATCYKMISSVSWSEAETSCSSDGGWLVTIETSAEDDWIKSTFSSTNKFWIGLTDTSHEGIWKWSQTGNTATYFHWEENQPDGGSEQNCVMTNSDHDDWKDYGCWNSLSALCEIGAGSLSTAPPTETPLHSSGDDDDDDNGDDDNGDDDNGDDDDDNDDNPLVAPSSSPTLSPSTVPSVAPSSSPTLSPSTVPSVAPSSSPTLTPSTVPSVAPSSSPTLTPSTVPSVSPSSSPTLTPSTVPSVAPSSSPTLSPSTVPSVAPTLMPSSFPTVYSPPTFAPTPLCNVSVVIVGAPSRQLFTSSTLFLQTALVDCQGSTVVRAETSYVWSVSVSINGGWSDDSSSSFSSVSSSADKFKLWPYSLQPSSTYLVRVVSIVNVNSKVTKTSSSSVIINVRQSSLVSQISGGSSQMVRQGEVLVVDGTGSYDPDVVPSSSPQASLLSEWSCVEFSAPSPSSNACVVSVSSSNSFKATIIPSSSSAVGTVYQVTLRVIDAKNATRASTSSILLTIATPNSPKITVSRSSSTRLNSQDSLLLIGAVQLYVPNTLVSWSVNDETLNTKLSSISETVVKSSSLGVGMNQFNLLISGGGLAWKSSNPYVFSLSAGDAVSSISVLMNRAPHSGMLVSNPVSGVVLDTIFRLSVSGWLDEEGDLPLMYEFYSMSNGKNVLKRRSEMLFVESMLPSGSSSNNFLLDCWVGVYDSLRATSSATVSVEVRFSSSSSSVSSSSLLEKSTALMSASDPSSSNSVVSESKLQVVSLLSSILNWKDCSLVPTPCSDLNREDCSSTTNTCGSCLSGYLGVTGDDNSLCVDEASFESSMSDSSVGCDLDSDCASWESCVSGMCEMKSKSCKVPDCSGHGECQFVDSESGDRVSSCGLLEMSCEATCFCDADYSGDHCDMSSSEMSDLQEIRSQMVVGLLSVASDGSDVSEGGLLSVLTSLSSVTRSPSELPLDSSNSVLEVLSVSLDQAEALKVSYESLSSDVLSSLNSVAMVQVRDGSETSSVDLLNLLGNFTGFVAGQLVADQSPVDSVSSMFRTRIQPLSFSNSNSASSLTSSSLSTSTSASDSSSSTITSSIPQTKAEIMSKAPSTSFSLTSSPSSTPLEDQGDGTVSLSLVSTLVKSSLVDLSSYSSVSSIPNSNSNAISSSVGTDSTQLTSNMLRLKMSGSGSSSISRIIVVLPTLRSQSYPVYESDEYVNTTCGADDFRETVHVCHGALGDVEITHHCDGTAGVIVSKCPRQSVQPSCSTAESSSYRCSVLNYTSISVTCVCELLTEGVGGRHRSLSTLSESGALEVVAVSYVVADSFQETLTTTMTVSDIQKVVVVMLLYGVMWGAGLLGIFMCSVRHAKKRRDVASGKSDLAVKKELASLTRSREDIRQYLAVYVAEVLPSVFRAKAGLTRFWEEVSKSHRYLLLFTASGEDGDKKRMLTGLHLLTVQSMLMFILAVFYDLQYPQDDGKCVTYETEKLCLEPKSVLDSSNHLCHWVTDSSPSSSSPVYYCESKPVTMTLKTIVIISIYVSIFTALINLVVDFLFVDILFAPTMKASNRGTNSKSLINAPSKPNKNSSPLRSIAEAAGESKQSNQTRRVEETTSRSTPLPPPPPHASLTPVVPNPSSNLQRVKRLTLSTIPSGTLELETTRVLPSATLRAHRLARLSVKDIIGDRVSAIRNTLVRQETIRRTSSRRRASFMKSIPLNEMSTEDQFVDLTVDIAEQRKELKRNQQEKFDEMWGIDPTGEFSKQRQSYFWFWTQSKSSAEIIKKELAFVNEEAEKKCGKLQNASDVQTGLEILHFFILDLLGRDTPVARIFLTKTEEDFRHSYVVSQWAKALAWVCVLLLNFFFVYFSMLRGLQRGLDWQRVYCVACVIQLVAEVLFYETSECALVNYFIPDLARTEVQGVTFAIHQAIQSMFSSTTEAKVPILDAPRYLFLSTRLAERFPDLLESVIVRSYHSYSPGELSRKWKISHASAFVGDIRVGSRVRRVTFTGMLVGLLQYLGSVSISVQRFFIHALQPVIMAGVATVIGLILSDPWYALILVPMFVYGSYLLWDHWRSNEDDDGSRENAIMPLPQTSKPANPPPIATSTPPPPPLASVPPGESEEGSLHTPISPRVGDVEVAYGSQSSEGDIDSSSVDFKHSFDDEEFHFDENSFSDPYSSPGAVNPKKQRIDISSSDGFEVNDLFDLESLELEEDSATFSSIQIKGTRK